MNTNLGYSKLTLTDENVLLSAGGSKPLSDFIGSIVWDSEEGELLFVSAADTSVGQNTIWNVLFSINPSIGIGSTNSTVKITVGGKSSSDYTIPYASTAGSAPASDVYDWAKASAKPTYKMSEVASISTVSVTSNLSSSCSITGSGNNGKSLTIIYTNTSGADKIITVPTTYKTPNNVAIELICPNNGYCEVNYLNISGTVYARGL